jgi:hypothetical protein
MEVEPDVRYTYMEVDHNFFLDGFVFLAMAPFAAGQIDVHHNILYTSEDWYVESTGLADSARTRSKIFKHTGTDAYLTGVQTGIHQYNNTCIVGKIDTQYGQMYETGDESDFTFTNSYWQDNIAVTYRSQKWELGGYVLSQYNIIYGNGSPDFVANDYKHVSAGGTSNYWDVTDITKDQRPVNGVITVDPGLGTTAATRFYIQSTSSAAYHGGSASTDLGAIPFGDTWSMPAVGCTYAYPTGLRPSVPTSISAFWIGR